MAPRLPSGRLKSWDERIRPVPENVRFFPSLQEAVSLARWDWILTHNIHDLLDCRASRLPKVFLVHGTLSGRILQDRSRVDREEYLEGVKVLLNASRCAVVYISQLKQQDWGLPGTVIRHGIDPSLYGGYAGDLPGVLQVANRLRERNELLGWDTHRFVCRDLPVLLMGDNPRLPGARMGESWEDLKEQYRRTRVYLHTSVYPHEDGYNLALLEAMATGMPVATMDHPTSPVRNGLEGIVASSPEELRAGVIRLLNDAEEARRLGAGARLRVETEFSISKFRSSWQALAERIVS